jgi:hypothetical protein
VPLENDLNIAIKGRVKNFTTDEFFNFHTQIHKPTNRCAELVNHPQEFDDAIPFIP